MYTFKMYPQQDFMDDNDDDISDRVRLIRVEKKVEECFDILLKFDKYQMSTNRASNNPQTSNTTTSKEDYSEFKGMKPATSAADLEKIEELLNKEDFRSKLIRFIKSIMKLDGKGDGGSIFRRLIRQFVAPEALTGYSWKGFRALKSFQQSFPNFISFVHTIVNEGDLFFVEESTSNAFSVYLRNKNTEIVRNEALEKNKNARRAPSSRCFAVPKRKKVTGSDCNDNDSGNGTGGNNNQGDNPDNSDGGTNE